MLLAVQCATTLGKHVVNQQTMNAETATAAVTGALAPAVLILVDKEVKQYCKYCSTKW